MKRATLIAVVAVLTAEPLAMWAKPPAVESAPKRSVSPAKQKAIDQYEKVLDCYMHSDFVGLKVEMARIDSTAMLPQSARADLTYIKKMIPEYRPPWWKNCRSATSISFQAKIWGRPFVANFTPLEPEGKRVLPRLVKNRIQVIAQWPPHIVDNPQRVEGDLAEAHRLTRGHSGEAIVWYELGRSYVPTFLPLEQVLFMYQRQAAVFSHIQEFLAGMSSLYHSSPKARLASLFMQVDRLKKNEDGSAVNRAAHAVGAMILARVLMEPDKWPGFKLPTQIPKTMVEHTTILYVYSHIDPAWSLAEDKALRDMAGKFVVANGKIILRTKGVIVLPNKLPMSLMTVGDREAQALRDLWIATRLNSIIKASKHDK